MRHRSTIARTVFSISHRRAYSHQKSHSVFRSLSLTCPGCTYVSSSVVMQTGCIVSADTVATFVFQVCHRFRGALAMAVESQAEAKTKRGHITQGMQHSSMDAAHLDLAHQREVDCSSGCPLVTTRLSRQHENEETPMCIPVMQQHFHDVAPPYEFLERYRDRCEHVHKLCFV